MSLRISTTALSAAQQMLASLDIVLTKGAAAAKARGVDETVFLNWRVAPDMHPFATQVRFATEIPARGFARLAGAPLPEFGEAETSFQDFIARNEKARTSLKGLSVEAIDADPEATIEVPMGDLTVSLPRLSFATFWILPNLQFHVSTAYLILRGLGVDLGKRDYLAGLVSHIGAQQS